MYRRRGFSLVELVVVIIIIGILTTIVTLGLARYQAQGRDARRLANATAISESLEKYYDVHGEYPGCSQVTQPAATATSPTGAFSGLNVDSLLVPGAPRTTTNYIQCNDLTSVSGPDYYGFVGDGSTDCKTGSSCLQFSLKYKDEINNRIDVINSRRRTSIATSGVIQDLSATATGFTTANLTWGAISNATGYDVQTSLDINFTSVVSTNTSPTNSFGATGLNAGTNYFFRVRPNSQVDQGGWSNTAMITTWSLAQPSLIAAGQTATSISYSWSTITHADSYTYRVATNSNFSSIVDTGTTSSTSRTSSALTAGTMYYVQVQATAQAQAFTSSWSNMITMSTVITPPPAFTITSTSTYNTLTATANATCPNAGTTPTYQWYANGSPWVSGTGYRTVSYTIPNGSTITLTASVACINAVTSSTYTAASNNVSLTWAAPWATIGTVAYRTIQWDGACPSGTTSQNFYWTVSGGTLTASGNSPTPGTFSDQTDTWGDGGANVTLSCYGPWGTLTAHGWGPFGGGCVPTVTKSQCYG